LKRRTLFGMYFRARTRLHRLTPSSYSTYIYCTSEERATFTASEIYFGSVPTDQLDTIHDKVIAKLKEIVAAGIDMDRIRLVIKRDKLKVCAEIFNIKNLWLK
jgi:hypothetical protein